LSLPILLFGARERAALPKSIERGNLALDEQRRQRQGKHQPCNLPWRVAGRLKVFA
jgi:hypothetical protein